MDNHKDEKIFTHKWDDNGYTCIYKNDKPYLTIEDGYLPEGEIEFIVNALNLASNTNGEKS